MKRGFLRISVPTVLAVVLTLAGCGESSTELPTTAAGAPSEVPAATPLAVACEALGNTLAGIDSENPSEQAYDAVSKAADQAAQVAEADGEIFADLSMHAKWLGDTVGGQGLSGALDEFSATIEFVKALDAALKVCVNTGAAMPEGWVS